MEIKDTNLMIVKDAILRTFYFLEQEYYFTPSFNNTEDPTFIERIQVEYINEIRRRNVRVSCAKGKIESDIVYTFNASITRIPYTGIEDYFSLNNYLESLGKDFATSLINDFDENSAEEILRKIAGLLKEHASKIIEGNIWLRNYYARKD